jgi:hypothetical protein
MPIYLFSHNLFPLPKDVGHPKYDVSKDVIKFSSPTYLIFYPNEN